MRKLLKESDIRQMMKLANIPALSDGFINKLQETSIYEQAPDEPEAGDVPADDAMALDAPADDAMDMDLPDDPDAAVEGGITVESGLEGLNTFLEAVTDPTVGAEMAGRINVQMGDEGEDLAGDPGLDDAGPEAEPVAGEFPEEEPEEEGPPEMMAELAQLEEEGIELEEDENFVNEVMKRVAKRLMKKR